MCHGDPDLSETTPCLGRVKGGDDHRYEKWQRLVNDRGIVDHRKNKTRESWGLKQRASEVDKTGFASSMGLLKQHSLRNGHPSGKLAIGVWSLNFHSWNNGAGARQISNSNNRSNKIHTGLMAELVLG